MKKIMTILLVCLFMVLVALADSLAGAIILNRQHVPILVIKGYRETWSARVAHNVIAGLIRFGGKL